MILIVAQFLRHPPAEAATPAAKTVAAGASQLGKRHFTTGEMLRTPQFYIMYAMFVLMATGGLLVTANAGPIATSWGYTTELLALAATLSPLANGASRVFWGWASDKTGRETAMVIAFTLQAICLLLVLVVGQISGAWFAVTLVLVYFTWGEVYSLFPALVGDYFGTRHATSNYGMLYSAKGVASLIGSWVGALLFEQFGTWAVGFYGSALMALVAAGLAVGLRARTAPRAVPHVVAATAK
jgi:OFA family oxalate/formate antiporter-like MFS transporter